MAASAPVQLPGDARRIVVRGNSGSGKTTLARAIAAAYGLEHVELDGLFHQPGWTTLPEPEFVARVEAATSGPAWVACGNYRAVVDLLLARADTAVLYDLPRRVVMRRVLARSLRRQLRREVLWNGNGERWRDLCSRDPERSIVMWTWTTHRRRHDQVAALLQAPPRDDLRLVHVATRSDERALYRALAQHGRCAAVAGAR